MSGTNAYQLSAAGIDVYPRLADPVRPDRYTRQRADLSSIPALDAMLTDGYWRGGHLGHGPHGRRQDPHGPALHHHGARRKDPGIIATMQENPNQLQRIAQGFGWSLAEDGIELLYGSPVALYIDQWVHELLAAIERTGARRVLIDSLGDLAFAAGDEMRYREYLYSLVQRCSRLGVGLLMTHELPGLFQLIRLSEMGVSHVSDSRGAAVPAPPV